MTTAPKIQVRKKTPATRYSTDPHDENRPFWCDWISDEDGEICGLTFKVQSTLRSHVSRQHLGTKEK